MKKWAYLLSGIVIGIAVSASSGSIYAQVKSLVGQKVTSEYTIVVNNKTLSEKGAEINGRTNAPVRALAESLGAELKVEGKTITITTATDQPAEQVAPESENKYSGRTKQSLENSKRSIEEDILAPTKKGREKILIDIEDLEAAGAVDSLAKKKEQLAEYDEEIAKYTAELAQIDEALAELN